MKKIIIALALATFPSFLCTTPPKPINQLVNLALCTTGSLSLFYRWGLVQREKKVSAAKEALFEHLLLDTHPDSTERINLIEQLKDKKKVLAVLRSRLDTATIITLLHLLYAGYYLGCLHAAQ